MNLVEVTPNWLFILLALLLVAAAIQDAVRLRISNITCLGVLVTALIAMGYAGFPIALWQNVVVFIALLAGGTLLFGAGQMGGGDVKLLAALGLWMSLLGALWLLAAVFIAGGVLAIAYLSTRRLRRRVSGPRETGASPGIPYGLAIVAGAFIVFAAQTGALAPKPEKPDPFAVKPLR